MKKTYQTPETLMTAVEFQQVMVETSNNYGHPELGQDLDKVAGTDDSDGNLSRRRSVWDDEE